MSWRRRRFQSPYNIIDGGSGSGGSTVLDITLVVLSDYLDAIANTSADITHLLLMGFDTTNG